MFIVTEYAALSVYICNLQGVICNSQLATRRLLRNITNVNIHPIEPQGIYLEDARIICVTPLQTV